MTELLPCPFCGGEAHITASSDGYGIECVNDDCVRTIMQEHGTEAEAIAAWNTRTERTCHMTRDADYPCAEEGCKRLMFPKWICSECEWDKLGEKPNYCPNCGAKVIDE